MYLTKKHLSRRTVLKGAGVAVALPLLDAMIPAATALADTAGAPKLRAGFFYIPHGAIMWNTAHGKAMDHWSPSGAGGDFRLSPIMAPLEKYKHLVASFGNLENKANHNSVHALVPATWLSGVRPNQDVTGADMAPTIDQMIAERIGQETALPSLEVASETTTQVAACPSGSACYYSTTLSFRNATSPLPMEFNPRKVFTQLFGEGDTPAERTAITHQTRSLLDLISERTTALTTQPRRQRPRAARRVSRHRARDRATRREIRATRSVRHRVARSADRRARQVRRPGQAHVRSRRAGYQANLTRVASYIMVAEGTNRTYNHIGVPDAFHPLSHHANDRERLLKLVKIQTYHMQRFADFVDKLASIPDGDGSLLDHSMFLYGSNMSNSDRHNNYPLPNILIGGACGSLKGGQHIDLPEHTTLTNLHLTVLNKVGFELESFVDSTGEIAGV